MAICIDRSRVIRVCVFSEDLTDLLEVFGCCVTVRQGTGRLAVLEQYNGTKACLLVSIKAPDIQPKEKQPRTIHKAASPASNYP